MGISYLENLKLDSVPNYIRARTPRGLRLAMLRNNTRLKAFVTYHNIAYVAKDGYWYAWFYEEMSGEGFEEVKRGD